MPDTDFVVLPDRMLVVGDAHANEVFIIHVLQHAEVLGIDTVLFVGDFWFYDERDLAVLDDNARLSGIKNIHFIDGNHEDFNILTPEVTGSLFPVKMSESLTYLPRGYVGMFESGLNFMTFGGAVSIDYQHRRAGVSWWPTEVPSDDDLQRALDNAGVIGEIDVLFCHDMSQEFLRNEGISYPPSQDYLFEARSFAFSDKFTRLVNVIHPQVVFHGHHHRKVSGMMENARSGYPHRPCQTFGLGADITSWSDAVAEVTFASKVL